MSSDPHLPLWSYLHSLPSSLTSHLAFFLVCPLTKLGPASMFLPFALAVPSAWNAVSHALSCHYLHIQVSAQVSPPHIVPCPHQSLSDTLPFFLFLIALLTLTYILAYLWVHYLSCPPKCKCRKNRNLISCSMLCHQHLEEFLVHDTSVMNIDKYYSLYLIVEEMEA